MGVSALSDLSFWEFLRVQGHGYWSSIAKCQNYLERHLDSFPSCGLEELVAHALRALRETLPTESDLTNKNTSVAVVGKGCEFEVGEDGGVDRWLALIEGEARTRRAPAAAEDADAPMDDAESQQDPEVPMDA